MTADQLSLLVRWCSGGSDEGEGVRYRELLELINWQQQLPTDLEKKLQQRSSAGNQMYKFWPIT